MCLCGKMTVSIVSGETDPDMSVAASVILSRFEINYYYVYQSQRVLIEFVISLGLPCE